MLFQDDLLTTKATDALFVIVSKQRLDLATHQPLRDALELLIQMFLEVLAACKLPVRTDVLRALSAVLFENGPYCQSLYQRLLEVLIPAASRTNQSQEIRRMAINCLGNLSTKSGKVMSGAQLDAVFKVLVGNLDFVEKGKSAIDIQVDRKVTHQFFVVVFLIAARFSPTLW